MDPFTRFEADCQEEYQQPQTCRWYHSNGRKQRGTKETLDKNENEIAGLKLNIQKKKNMASSPTTSWQIEGGKSGNSDRLYFLGLQNHSVDKDYRHEIQRCLLLGRKVTANLDSVFKSRDIILAAKVRIDKAKLWFFSSHIWMWELDH